MNIYKVFITILFLWCSVFTVSLAMHHFKYRRFLPAVNAIILQIIALALCLGYIF